MRGLVRPDRYVDPWEDVRAESEADSPREKSEGNGNHQTFEKEQRYEHLSVPPSYAPELVSKLFTVVTRSAAKQTEMPE